MRGLLYTGIQPGYTDKTLFLPADSKGNGVYWTSTLSEVKGYGTSLDFNIEESSTLRSYHLSGQTYAATNTKYLVRPVLAK